MQFDVFPVQFGVNGPTCVTSKIDGEWFRYFAARAGNEHVFDA